MRSIKLSLLACILTFSLSALAGATKEEMVQFVKEAAAFAKKVGKDAALKEFSNPTGKFQKGELYIYAYDFTGTCVAHGQKASLVGKNLIKFKDQKGKEMIKELVETAQKGSGFVDFHWQNPVSKKVEPKIGYVEKIDDSYWIGSGIYK